MQRALAEAVTAFGARVRNHGEIPPFPGDREVSGTDVAVAVAAMLKAAEIYSFEIGAMFNIQEPETVSTDNMGQARLLPERQQDHYLVNAEREARRRGLHEIPVVDCDSHCYETACLPEIIAYLENPNIRRSFMFNSPLIIEPGLISGNMGDRTVGGRVHPGGATAGQEDVYPIGEASDGMHPVAGTTLRSMDAMGIDYSIVFPTPMLNLGLNPDLRVRDDLTWAFNRWLVEDVIACDERLLSMPLLPIHDPDQCLRNINAFAGRPGVVGFMITALQYEPLHRNPHMKVFDALNDLGLPVAFHSAPNWRERPFAALDSFLGVHALGFPFYAMIQLTNIVLTGMPERFPDIRWIFMEAGRPGSRSASPGWTTSTSSARRRHPC